MNTKATQLIREYIKGMTRKSKTIIVITFIFLASLNLIVIAMDDKEKLNAMTIMIELFKLLLTIL